MKIRAKYAPVSAVNSYQYFGFVPSSSAFENPSEMFFTRENPTNAWIEAWSGNSGNSQNTIIPNQDYFGSYHNYEILWRQNEAKFIIDDVLKATQTTSVADTSMPVGMYDYNTAANLAVDWVFVRNYVSPEPAWGVWSPEQASGNPPTPTPGPTPTSTYSLVKVGTSSNYYVELISKVSNVKVLFYVDGVLYRTETTARYCLFGGDVCATSALPAGQHIIAAKTYDKTTGVLLDTQSITIGQGTPTPTPTPTPGPTPTSTYSLVKVGTSSNYYVELISQVSNVKVLFYVDGVLYRTETTARYCLFGGDVCAPSALPAGQHIIAAKTYDKTTGVLLDTQSITIGQGTPTPTPGPTPTSTYSLVKVGTSSNYYVELISKVSNVKVLFYVDSVLYRTETTARYCLFGGDVCAASALPAGQHIIAAKTYDKTTGVLLDTQSITI